MAGVDSLKFGHASLNSRPISSVANMSTHVPAAGISSACFRDDTQATQTKRTGHRCQPIVFAPLSNQYG